MFVDQLIYGVSTFVKFIQVRRLRLVKSDKHRINLGFIKFWEFENK